MPTVSFDGKTWYRLASIAEGQGVTIAQLLAQAAGAVRAGPRPLTLAGEIRAAKYAAKSEVVAAEVVHLREQGMKVASIAEMLGYSPSYVSKVLCANGHRSRTRSRNKTKAAGRQEWEEAA